MVQPQRVPDVRRSTAALHVYHTETGWVWRVEGGPTSYREAMRLGDAALAAVKEAKA